MSGSRPPLPEPFLHELADLEAVYLQATDPIEQSGFHGGPQRWRAERGPILDALDGDGDLLDACCANGYLLECLVTWGREQGLTLTPWGLDKGPGLIALAQSRLPDSAAHFFTGNSWDWEPPRRFRYVYTLLDVVPPEYEAALLHRLLERVVAPGGRLIAGDYGSRSRGIPPRDVAAVFRAADLPVAGEAAGGNPPVTRFAWTVREQGGGAALTSSSVGTGKGERAPS